MKLVKQEEGQALVEFAIVAMLLFLILFGIIEFGRIFHGYLVVTHAAREGARQAAVDSNDGMVGETIKNSVDSLNVNVSKASKVNVKSSAPIGSGELLWCVDRPEDEIGKPVYVYVKVMIDPIISELILKEPRPIRSSAVMRIES